MKTIILLISIFLLSSCQKCVEYKDIWIEEQAYTSYFMVGKVLVLQFHTNPAHTGSTCIKHEEIK